jgi:unsaturated rhamnogalacturonyl hydrolase
MAESVIRRNVPFAWRYEHGLALQSLWQVGQVTRDARYAGYVQSVVDPFIDADGSIKTLSIEEYNLDQINPGKVLLLLYQVSGEERYRRALHLLRRQLKEQPRNRVGGFWHKQIYPHQMWLDGIYMAAPFYAAYGRTFAEPTAYDDVANQIILIEQHTRDPKTGLLYHAWDERKQQRWADPETGCSPNFWGRAMGWYAMALVDVLEWLPPEYAKRDTLIAIFQRMVAALVNVQDRPTGLWYQVLDQGNRAGNYLEASASCMFVYAIAKAVRCGYLAAKYLDVARKAYLGILGNLIDIDERGLVNLNGICGTAGLGGTPYRDGSFEYYIGEKIVTNDYKGVGSFILASIEIESMGFANNL